jgi:hypothetical protein
MPGCPLFRLEAAIVAAQRKPFVCVLYEGGMNLSHGLTRADRRRRFALIAARRLIAKGTL